MAAQQLIAPLVSGIRQFEIKGIKGVAGRMIDGNIQGREIVKLRLDLRAFLDDKTQPLKDPADLIDRLCEDMLVPDGSGHAGDGEIDVRGGRLCLPAFDLFLLCLNNNRNIVAQVIGASADQRSLVVRQS